ncbi:MAG: hypothetical protein ACRDR6_24030 [Pseudonocardiaceae bacterium]
MITAIASQPLTITDAQPVPVFASTVLSVVMRVAGPVPTDVRPYALGHPEQQVTARIGDAVIYLTESAVVARIRQQWDAAHYLAAARLPERVSPTWLAPQPASYPVGVVLRLTGTVEVATQWITGRSATNTPAHLRVRVDRLVCPPRTRPAVTRGPRGVERGAGAARGVPLTAAQRRTL